MCQDMFVSYSTKKKPLTRIFKTYPSKRYNNLKCAVVYVVGLICSIYMVPTTSSGVHSKVQPLKHIIGTGKGFKLTTVITEVKISP